MVTISGVQVPDNWGNVDWRSLIAGGPASEVAKLQGVSWADYAATLRARGYSDTDIETRRLWYAGLPSAPGLSGHSWLVIAVVVAVLGYFAWRRGWLRVPAFLRRVVPASA